jgi:biliverdin reductase/flavin reductase
MKIKSIKGNTGLECAKQALERGHQVTALVRNPDALKDLTSNENFKVDAKIQTLRYF